MKALDRRWLRPSLFAALSLAAVAVAGAAFAAKPLFRTFEPTSAEVTAIPFDLDRERPDRVEFGKLRWRGGLVLVSPLRYFGGWSGIALDSGGDRAFAISDAGVWLEVTLRHDGRMLKGVTDAAIGPMSDAAGKVLQGGARDAESLAVTAMQGNAVTALVGFERRHRIDRYRLQDGRFRSQGPSLALPKAARRMSANSGLEALGVFSSGPLKGAVIAFSEQLRNEDGNLEGWLIGGPKPGAIALRPIDNYDITDLAILPDGGILVLERRFRFTDGVRMRIRRVAADDIRQGAILEGETLIDLDQRYNIDNMEGIAVSRSGRGETIVTVISDNNYSPIQRTLLMQFALP